jgi:hypothetical protein
VELIVLEHDPDAGVAGFAEVLDARQRTHRGGASTSWPATRCPRTSTWSQVWS